MNNLQDKLREVQERLEKIRPLDSWEKGLNISQAKKGKPLPQYRKEQNAEVRKGKKHSQEVIQKMKESRAKFLEKNPNFYADGRYSSYGRGFTYIEITSGFIGTVTDIMKHFNLPDAGYLSSCKKRNAPITKGKFKGLHFQIYQP